MDDLGKVSKVEHVMALGRRGQEIVQDRFVEGQRSLHNGVRQLYDGSFKFYLLQSKLLMECHLPMSYLQLVTNESDWIELISWLG